MCQGEIDTTKINVWLLSRNASLTGPPSARWRMPKCSILDSGHDNSRLTSRESLEFLLGNHKVMILFALKKYQPQCLKSAQNCRIRTKHLVALTTC